MVFLIW